MELNYEIIKCRVCEKEFKRNKIGKRGRTGNIRKSNSITCSKRCSVFNQILLHREYMKKKRKKSLQKS